MKAGRRYGGLAVGLTGAVLLTAVPPVGLTAQDSFPTRPPAPTPLAPVRFPAFLETLLPNGITVVVVEHHEQPVASVSLSFRAGNGYDPAGKEGLSQLVAELLTKGTTARGAEQIAAAIEGVGGSLSAFSDADFLTVSADVLSDHLELAFDLLGDVTLGSTFPATELELARTRYLSALALQLSQPAAVADRYFARELYGGNPYGRRPTADSYRAITRDDIARFATERLRPRGALLVVAGDVTQPQVAALTRRVFGGWSGAPAAAAATPAPPAKTATDIVLVHRPGSAQSNIVVGNTTFLPVDAAFYPIRLATQILGGSSDSRLYQILREQKGWTYSTRAALQRYRGLGYWQASAEVRTEVTDSALSELLRQVDRIRTEALPDSDLVNAKSFLVGVFPLTIETPNQIASQVSTVKLLGLGPEYLRLYRERLSAVTPIEARAAAARLYRRNALTIVVVGDGAKTYEKLTAIAPVRIVDVDGKPLTVADLTPKASPLALDRAQIVARTDSFRVLIQGNPFGGLVTSTRLSGDSLVFTEHTVIGPVVDQSTTVVLDAATVTVKQVDQSGMIQGQRTETHLSYAEGRVKGRAVVPQPGGAPKTIDIDTTLVAGTYDDNVVNLVLPALPLEPGKTFSLNVFTSSQGTARVLTIKVGAPEAVTVPAGTFQVYRLDVTGAQAPLVVFVTTATPRRLVKTEVVGAPFVFELVK